MDAGNPETPDRFDLCSRCGALVGDRGQHDTWHAGIETAYGKAEVRPMSAMKFLQWPEKVV